MKQRNRKKGMLKDIFTTIQSKFRYIVGGVVCIFVSIFTVNAKNEDTPNLDFSMGNFTGWETYYAYYGAVNFSDDNSPNIYTNSLDATSVSNQEVWTLRTGSKEFCSRDGYCKDIRGSFTLINSRDVDPNVRSSCSNPIYTLPNNYSGGAARVGSSGQTEVLYNYENPGGWRHRAMAEKLVYKFRVTEKSTLLKLNFASVMLEPVSFAGSHFGDEHPSMCLDVTAKLGEEVKVLPCGEYCGDASSNDNTLQVLSGSCLQYNDVTSGNNLTYKPWTTNIYDLRDFIGYEITIETYVHDCLLELYVCQTCNIIDAYGNYKDNGNGDLRVYCQHCHDWKKAWKRAVAGGHVSYGYITGETTELKIDVDNCPDDDKVKITVPEGFGEGNYTWKTSDGVTLLDDNGNAYTNNTAYVNRAEIQDVDYICTIKGSNADCADISISTRIAKDPIVMDFVASNACYNDVTFTDQSYISTILQDNQTIQPDTIIKRTWKYDDGYGHSGTLADTTVVNDVFPWTSQNGGKYKMTLTVETSRGCTMSLTKDFKVQPRPSVELSGSSKICRDNESELKVTNFSDPSNKYVWKKCTAGASVDACTAWQTVQDSTSTNSPNYEIEGTNDYAGIYQVEIFREEKLLVGNIEIGTKQCMYTKDFTVSISENPSFDFKNYSTKNNHKYVNICKNETTEIEVVNDDTKVPSADVVFSWSNTEKGTKINVGPSDTTKYTVTATSTSGCKSLDSIWVNVKPLPKLNIDGPSAICVDQTATLKAEGLTGTETSSYVWKVDNTDLNKKGQTSMDITGKKKAGTIQYYIYKLEGTNSLGCSNTYEMQVTVRDTPNVTVPTPDPICEGKNVVINVYNADSCQWNDGAMKKVPTESSISEVPTTDVYDLKAYLYYADVTCQSHYKIPITINKNPEVKIEGPDGVCKGGDITLTASDTASYVGQPNSGSIAYTYKWNDVKNTATAQLDATPAATSSYTITIDNGTCSGSATKQVNVYSKPDLAIAPLYARVCPNQPDTVIAEKGLSFYRWFAVNSQKDTLEIDEGATLDSLPIIITKDTTIYFEGTDANGCSNIVKTEITVKPTPTLGQVGPSSICDGSPLTIAPKGADEGTYWWSRKYDKVTTIDTIDTKGGSLIDTVSSKKFGNSNNVTYTVYGTKDGCEGSFTNTIKINPQPEITITGNSSICKGEKTTLTASCTSGQAISSWNWTGMNSTKESLSVSPITNQTYFVVATAASGGCNGNAEFTVTVNNPPSLTIEGGDPICAGSRTELSVKADGERLTSCVWNWTKGAGSTVSNEAYVGDNDSILTAELSGVTLFSVTATNSNNCSSYKTKAVLVYDIPTITTDAKEICQGDNVDISADGAATYKWYKSANGKDYVSSGTRYRDNNVSPTATSYTVYVIGQENGCTKEEEVTFDIKRKPDIQIAGKHLYCQGDTIELTASNGTTYLWSNGSDGSTMKTVANNSITEISVTGIDQYSCVNTDTFEIEVKDLPAIDIEKPAKTDICINDSVTLKAENGATYQWFTTSQATGNEYTDTQCTDGKCATIKPRIQATTKYVVEGAQSHNGTIDLSESVTCKSSAEITITARPKPVVVIDDVEKICPNTATNLTASNTESTAIISSWAWYSEGSDLKNNKSYQYTGNLASTKEFVAVATTNYGCTGKDTAVVELHPIHTVAITGDNYVCEDGTIQLKATVKDDTNKDVSDNSKIIYNWAPQGGSKATTNDMKLGQTTEFTLTITDPNSCQATATPKTVEWIALPKITIEHTPSENCASDNTVTLTAKSSNKANKQIDYWTWTNADGDTLKDASNNKLTAASFTEEDLAQTTTYKATATDTFGCTSAQETHVVEINDAPDLTITGVTTACLNSTIELTAASSKNASIYWTDNLYGNNHGLANSEARKIKLTTIGKQTFKAEITVNGCTTEKEHVITVYGNPDVTLKSDNGKNYVCQGEGLALTATAENVDFSWNIQNNDQARNTITPSSNPTTVIVTVEDANHCTDTAKFDIHIQQNPILSINGETAGDTTVCIDSPIELTASGLDNNAYQWNGSATISNKTYAVSKVTSETEYTVNGSNSYGCIGSAKYTVKTKPYPTVTPTNAISCEGDVSTVKATGDADYYTWKWSTGTKDTTATGSNYSEILTTSRTYQLTGTKNGCTTTAVSVTATVEQKPTINIKSKTNNQTGTEADPVEICFNSSEDITASGNADTYTWASHNDVTASGSTATIEPSSLGTHVYTVEASKNYTSITCTAKQSVNVDVKGLPNVKLTGDKSVCYNETANVTASGATTYEWTIDGVKKTLTDNTKFSEKLKDTTSFSVIGYDGCYSLPTTYTVAVKPQIQLSWTEPQACANGEVSVEVKGATSIEWEDGKTTGSSRTLTNVVATKNGYAEYPITAWYNGCSIDTVIKVKVNGNPTITFDASKAGKNIGTHKSQICLNEDAEITASSDDPTATITWSGFDEGEPTMKVTPKTVGEITYKVTATSNGCPITDSWTIAVLSNPTIKINDEINGSTSICVNEAVKLTATGVASNYTWETSSDNGSTYSALTPTTINTYDLKKASANALYKVTGTDENGCKASTTYNVTVNSKPSFKFNYTPVCAGTSNTIKLTDFTTTNTQYSWEWIDESNPSKIVGTLANATSLTQTLTANRKYIVTATTKEGCTYKDSLTAIVNPLPVFAISNDVAICNGESTILSAGGYDKYDLTWTDNKGAEITHTNGNITVQPTTNTTYTATSVDKTSGCSTKQTVTVKVNALPNPEITQQNAACVGNTIILNAGVSNSTGNEKYEWFDEASTVAARKVMSSEKSLSYKITTATMSPFTLYLKATNTETSCHKEISYLVAKTDKPIISVLGDTVRCNDGTEGTIRLSGAERYTWKKAKDGADYVGSSYTEILAANKTYQIHAESGACSADTIVSVKVNAIPSATISGDESICLYESTELEAITDSKNATYKWNTSSTNSSVNVTAENLQQQVFKVTVTDSKTSCQNSATKTVKVKQLPNVEISNDNEYCQNSAITLTANATYKKYQWAYIDGSDTIQFNNGTTKDYVTTLNETTTYLLTATDATTGCSNSASKEIKTKDLPTLAVTAPDVCQGRKPLISVDKSKSKADYYIWPDKTSNNSSWTANEITTATDYTFNAYLNGCLSKDTTITVNVTDRPTIVLRDKDGEILTNGGSIVVCKNKNDVEITAEDTKTNATYYVWNWSNSSSNGAKLTDNPVNQTTYQVTATNTTGCKNTATQTVLVNTPTPIILDAPSQVCEGGTVTITASGVDKNITWTVTPTPLSKDIEISADNKTYTIKNCTNELTVSVSGTDKYSCDTQSDEYTIAIIKNPELTITPSVDKRYVCQGSALKLSAKGIGNNISINWDGGTEGYLDYTFASSKSGSVTAKVTGTTTEGCSTDSIIAINVYDLPSPIITGDNFCLGGSTELTCSTIDNRTISTYKWIGSNDNSNKITVSKAGSYSVTVTDLHGCVGDTAVTIETLDKPTISIERANISWTDDKTACKDSTIILTANGNSNSYVWQSNGKNLNATGAKYDTIQSTITATTEFKATGSITYKLKSGNTATCTNEETYTVSVATVPTFDLTSDSVCSGNTAKINVINSNASGTSYDWTWEGGSQHGGNYHTESNLTAAKKFTVTGTLGHCSNTKNYTAGVYALPTINEATFTPSTNGNELCINETKTVSVTATSEKNTISSYTWSANRDGSSMTPSGASLTIKPTQTGERTYTVTVTDSKNCQSQKEIPVIVNALPTITVNGSTNVCPNSSIELTVAGDYDVIWYEYNKTTGTKGSVLKTGKSTDVFTKTISKDTTFLVSVSDDNSCSNEKVVNITVKALPTLTLVGNTTICLGEATEVSLIGNATGKNYLQKADKSYTTESLNTFELSPATVGDTIYKIRSITANECTIDTTIKVSVKALPTITINDKQNGSSSICFNSSTTLTAQGGTSYKWNNKKEETTNTVKPLATTDYYVVGTNADGCSDTAWHTVNVQDLPAVTITGEEKACEDSITTLTISDFQSGYTYNWRGDNIIKNNNSSLDIKMVNGENLYKVICTDNTALHCSNTDSFIVNSKPNPVITIDGNNQVCQNDYVTIKATSDLASSTYSWKESGSTTVISTLNSITQKVDKSKTYTVYVTKDGCTNQTNVTTQYYALPVVAAEITNDPKGDNIICYKNTADLKATVTSGTAPYSYTWVSNYIDSDKDKSSTTSLELTNTNTPYEFVVKVEDANKCKGTDTVAVTIRPNPTITITGDKSACDGQNATITASGVTTNDYKWNNGLTDVTITPTITKNDTFTVTGTDEYGCVNTSKPWSITKKDNPTLYFSGKREICKGEKTTITVTGAGANNNNYFWEESKAYKTSLTVSPAATQKYNVTGTLNGCSTDTFVEIVVNELPVIAINNVNNGSAYICENDKYDLNVTENVNFSYLWNNNSTNASIQVQPSVNTEYTVNVTDITTSCHQTDTFTVKVNQLPIVTLSTADAVCQDSIIKIIAETKDGYPTPDTYKWNGSTTNGGNSFSETVTSLGSKEYTLTTEKTENSKLCSYQTSVTIESKKNPAIEITAPTDVCLADNVTLKATATSDADYYAWPGESEASTMSIWSKGTTNVGENQYTVTGINRYVVASKVMECKQVKTYKVNVRPLPQLKIEGPAYVCEDKTDELSVSETSGMSLNNDAYKWSTGEIGTSIEINAPTEPVKYTVTATTPYNCSSTASFTLYSKDNPDFSIEGATAICYGNKADLTIAGGKNLKSIYWYKMDGNTIAETLGTTDKISPTVTEDMVIKVVTTNTDNCDAEKTFNITVKENPTITIDAPKSICVGSTAKLSVSGATSWSWDHKASLSANLSEKIDCDTTFTVHGTTNGCTTDSIITIKVNALPILDIEASKPITLSNGKKVTEICYKDSISLTAKNATTYVWENLADGKTATITKSPAEKTEYVVEGTDANGCKSNDTITVKVNTLPTFTVPASTKVCNGETTTIAASADKVLNYNWSGTYGTKNPTYTTPAVTSDITYSVTARDENGCVSDTVKYELISKPNPGLKISGEEKVCIGNSTTLSVVDTVSSVYQTTYVWNETKEGSTFTTDAITSKTTFSVEGTKDGCQSTKTFTVDTYSLPTILINNGDAEISTCRGGKVTLTGYNGVEYKWDNKPGLTGTTYEFKPTTDGEIHTVEGEDENGCINTDEIKVRIQELPVITISGLDKICIDSTVVLTASNKNCTYEWKNKDNTLIGTPSSNTQQLSLIITQDTFVYASATDNTTLKCQSTASYEVKSKINPTITTVKQDAAVCNGSFATIVVGGDAETYTWKDEKGTIVSESNSITQQINQDGEKYTVYVDKEGCKNQQSFTIGMYALPSISLSNQAICYGKEATLTTTKDLKSYVWENLTSKTKLESTTYTAVESPAVTSEYQVTVTNDNNCEASAKATITVNPLPDIKLTYDKSACEGKETEVIATNEDYTYMWEQNDKYTSTFTHNYEMGSYPNEDTFTVYAKTTKGCVDSTTISIQTKQTPQLNLSFNDSICYEKTTTLSGLNSRVKYVWMTYGTSDTLSTTSSYLTPSLTEKENKYKVIGTMNGCEADTVINVHTWDLPNIKIENSPSMVICKDNALTLNVENPTSGWFYKWDNNPYKEDATSYDIAPIKTTTYQLNGRDNHGCENKDNIQVELQERPTFAIVGQTAVCVGGTAKLKATNDNLKYVWYNEKDEKVGETIGTSLLAIKVTQDTILKVKGYTEGRTDCDVEVKHSIKATAFPDVTIAKADDKVCKNTEAYIEVKSDIDATFEWDSNETTRYIQKLITKDNSQFTVTVTSTDTTHCQTKRTFTVGMLELPVIVTKDTAVCYGDTARLTASSAANVTLRWTDATEDGPSFTTSNLTAKTTYIVRGTDDHHCVGEAKASVEINALPQFSLDKISPVCVGWETTITADDNELTYVWEDDKDGTYQSGTNFKHTVGQDTTFTVWAKDKNQCKSKKEVKVSVKQFPTLTLRMDTNYVCYNESRTVYVTGANNGYVWNDASTSNYLRLENIKADTVITVTGTTNGCPTTVDTTIHVWALPNITITNVAPICLYDSTTLIAENGIKYKWNNGDTSDRITVTPAKSGNNTYFVTGTDVNGCKNADTIDVVVNQLPSVTIEGTQYVCRGTNATLSAVASSATSYEWHKDGIAIAGANDKTFEPVITEDVDTFWVVVTNATNCVDSASFEVHAKDFPILSHKTSTGRDSICKGSTIAIYMSGAESYRWEDDTEDNSYTAAIETPTTFTVYGTTNECTTPYTITIDTLQLPIFDVTSIGAICLNDSIVLTAGDNMAKGGKLTYQWRHNGATTNTITESPISDKTYYVTGTDQYGCKATFSENVIINALPTDLKIEGKNAICKSDEVTLTATAKNATSYTWYINADTTDAKNIITTTDADKVVLNIVQDTTVYVVAADAKGCKFMTSYNVSMIEHPTLEFFYKDEICMGSKSTISVKGATSYLWNDKSTKSYRTDVITQDTTFEVTGYANGCSTTETIPVSVLPLPTITVDLLTDKGVASNEICKGQGSITMTGKGGESGKYSWSTKQMTDAITVSPMNDMKYTLIGTDAKGCQNSIDTTIIVHTLPVVIIESVDEMCERDSFDLVAKSTNEYVITDYTWTGYSDYDGQNTMRAVVTSDQTFYVKLTDQYGCYNTGSHKVSSKAYPSMKLDAPSYVCKGTSAIISAQGANTYKWLGENGTTQRSFVDTPLNDTTYVVEGTTNGCTSTDSITVLVKELPIIQIESEENKDAICLNNSITLTGKGGLSYSWNTGAQTQLITVHPLVDTKYVVTGKDINKCTNEAEFTVKVNPLPSFEIKGKDLICQGDIDTLWVEGDEATYTWTSHSNLVADTMMWTMNTDQQFTVKAVDANNCTSTQIKNVKTKAYPVVKINAPDAICEGSVANITATGAATYVWNDGRTLNSLADTILNTTTYTVQGTTNGCTTTQTHTIKKWELPDVQISGQNDMICFGDWVYLEASGAASYIWSDGSTQVGIRVNPTATTDYYVIGKSVNNCEARDTFSITVNSLPKVTIEGASATCDGDRDTLVAKGAKSYVWPTTGETTDTIAPIIDATKVYVVIGTDENGCVSQATKQVKKKEIPTVTYSAPTNVCLGKIASITAMGANNYIWRNENGDSIGSGNTFNAIPERMTTYTVVGISDGCQSSKNITVDTWSLPTITISGDNEICVNDAVTLSASGATNYVWSTGLQSNTLVATPLSTTTFTVTGRDDNGCENVAKHTVSVRSLPDFTITGERSKCEGEVTTLSGVSNTTDTYNYTWSWVENGERITSSQQFISPVINSNTVFTVLATDMKNCQFTQSITVTSKPYPTLSFVAPVSVCDGEGISINVFGANEYKWSNGSTTNQISDYPENTGIVNYSVEGTTEGCTSKGTVSVNVMENPVIMIDGPTEICNGSSVTLTASGDDIKLYEWSNGINEATITSYPNVTSKYTVKGTSSNGCSSTNYFVVTVNQKPVFDILSENEICAGQNLEMMASGNAKTYYWGYGEKSYTDNISLNNKKITVPITRGTYIFVKGVDENNCYNEAYKQIKAITPPSIFYTGENEVCLGGSITLVGQGGASYVWNLNGKNYASPMLTFQPEGKTSLTLTGTLDLCSSTINIDVVTKDVPELEIIGKTTICKGQTATLTANGAVSYAWSTGETERTISHELKTSMNYIVTGTGYNGCTTTKAVTVAVNPLPNVKIVKDSLSGCPEVGTKIKMHAKGATDYEWSCEPENADISGILADHIDAQLFEDIDLYLVGVDENNCVNYDTMHVAHKTFAPIQFEVSPRVIEDKNPIVQLNGQYPVTNDWTWEPGEVDGETTFGRNETHTYQNTYEDSFLVHVTAVDSIGCAYSGETYVYVWHNFWAPNAFSPNNDGLNDTFGFLGTECMTEFEYIIYNRIGTIVHKGYTKDDRWDGTDLDGEKCPWGVYGYVVKYKSDYMSIHKSGEKKGTVTLER